MKPVNYGRVQSLMSTRNELEYVIEQAQKHQLTLRIPVRYVIPSKRMERVIIDTLKAEIKAIDKELETL